MSVDASTTHRVTFEISADDPLAAVVKVSGGYARLYHVEVSLNGTTPPTVLAMVRRCRRDGTGDDNPLYGAPLITHPSDKDHAYWVDRAFETIR